MTFPQPPRTDTADHVRLVHGDAVPDPYEWLRDRTDPRVVAWLEAQNSYAEEMTAHLAPLRRAIVAEISTRTQQTDLSVPVRYRDWWYFTRTREGAQYPIACRAPGANGARPQVGEETLPGEQVLLDGNAEAGGAEFFAVGASAVSGDGRRYAFSADRAGDERFDVTVRDIASGDVVDDAVLGAGYGLVWSADDTYFFYTRVDDAWRSWQVWRHRVGGPATDDVCIFSEEDERFWVGIGDSAEERWLVISTGSKNTSETHLLDLRDPTGELRCVAPRTEGVEYDVETAGDVMLITHNRSRADFEVAWAPVRSTSETDWVQWLAPEAGERVAGVSAFSRHVVVSLRSGGFPQLRVIPRLGGTGVPARDGQGSWLPGARRGEAWQVPTPEVAHTIGVGDNPDYEAGAVLVGYESLRAPGQVWEVDLDTREQRTLRVTPVLGGFDQHDYVSRQLTATAGDGTPVPISVVAHKDTPLDGTAPGILYVYGAYEASLDPWFSIPRLSLLDRGVVWAIGHVRGGGELGRSWYEEGRLHAKTNTFTDTVACAEKLVDAGVVAPDRLGLEGGSAGGLTVGAAINLAPQRFAVVHADVPFVDALNTILDPSQPLTVTEWEEWGDPVHDEDMYRLMKAYSPYENVRPGRYPAVLATTSLNDTRVSYAEPAKWVARLQARVESSPERPTLLRTEMVAGHGGRSGRYDAWAQYAWEESFVLGQLGATQLRVAAPVR